MDRYRLPERSRVVWVRDVHELVDENVADKVGRQQEQPGVQAYRVAVGAARPEGPLCAHRDPSQIEPQFGRGPANPWNEVLPCLNH